MPLGRLITNSIAAAALLAGLGVLGASPAAAQIDEASTTGGHGEYCWVSAESGASVCVEDERELLDMVAHVAGVRILAADAAGSVVIDSLEPAARRAAPLRAETIVARLYDDVGFGGGYAIVTSPNGCTGGIAQLGSIGWNDRGSSLQAYAGCRSAVFEHEFYGGATSGHTASASSLGSMNDRASSVRVSS